MIRGRYFTAPLAIAVSCCSLIAYGQTPAATNGPTGFSISLNLGALPGAEPVATPPATPAGTPAINSTASSDTTAGLSADAPWFQRFMLPVPEAAASVDDWLSCSRPGVMANADYLNWSARRSGQDFAAFVSPTSATAPTTASESLDLGRASGCRAGVGYRFGNGWNVAWTYTYFFTASTETVTADPTAAGNPTLIATQSYLDTGSTVKTPMTSVEADGTLQINIHDFEAEWSSCLNDTIGFKAFGGFRWAKINQNFNMNYTYAAGTGTINLPNDMDAEGVRLGAEFQWRSTYGLRAFARGAESILVADFQTRQTEVATASGVNIDVSGTTTEVVPVFEAAVGVAYARGPWEFRAGYEMSDWFNLVQVNRPTQSLLIDGYFLSLSFAR